MLVKTASHARNRPFGSDGAPHTPFLFSQIHKLELGSLHSWFPSSGDCKVVLCRIVATLILKPELRVLITLAQIVHI